MAEHAVSILKNLLQNTTDTQRDRVIFKFKEKQGEKVERLVELHSLYSPRFRNYKLLLAKAYGESEEEERKEQVKEGVYVQQIKEGLFILMLVDLLIGFLIQTRDEGIMEKLEGTLALRKVSLEEIVEAIYEYASNVEEGKGQQKEKVLELTRDLGEILISE